MGEVKGRPGGQDVSWFIDNFKNERLDLEPNYQRRSVWSLADRKYFLDTIFRDYPCPPVYLHKTVDDNDVATYHVIDGKQRLETIIMFVEDKIAISKAFGDERLAGKKWRDLKGQTDLKDAFWNYSIPVEQINTKDGTVVASVFDRLNRNSRKLTRQEMRHARFEGWLISLANSESEKDEWEILGISSKARAKRMQDVQFISELILVLLEGKQAGFDQDHLDAAYADYEAQPEEIPHLSEEKILKKLALIKKCLLQMNEVNSVITEHATGFGHFYTLWSTFALWPKKNLPTAKILAERYKRFMDKVVQLASQKDVDEFLKKQKGDSYKLPHQYHMNTLGPNTDLSPREKRRTALTAALLAP
jgi:hypothetical protein